MTKISEILTIVIPCKNEGKTIKKTLEFLNKQKFIEGTKVIIADSSDDKGFTLDCINDESDKKILIEVIPGGYPGVARNNGAKKAKTKYILFLDGDMFIKDKDLLSKLLSKMEKKDLHLLTTRIRTGEKKYDHIYRIFDAIQATIRVVTPFAVGGFMLFKKDIFVKLGGFNPKDKFAEDFHLSSKINPKKFRIDKSIIYTTPRRFKKTKPARMGKLMVETYLNQNNNKFFEKEHNYWV